MSAAVPLRAAIFAALSQDAALAAMLGGAKIYDEPPKALDYPFVTLGEAEMRDASTMTEPGEETTLTLNVYSRQGGHREAHAMVGAVMEALVDAPLALAGHHLANLRIATAEVRRDGDGRTYRGRIRIRAVTEPA
ncbi:DUF3168 domain-containing protein [Blastochloris viridis]|uniref:Gene transfer agent protein n=1 Tax=Blastochloris viridis TaxID=1079 RepID=A0A0H5BPW0_BLAVI|nr:DUF3168 domain-containing protein [Blastochloris viridis]ALK10123.1 hypothetical protein BVIR_2356 [Blastochloris viridis]BAR99948.1 gene transfer agent protein [Blastochloris viridis]CUU42787.1 hypothetical protein BVIRIDIS_18020 [Blastochloris viridis]